MNTLPLNVATTTTTTTIVRDDDDDDMRNEEKEQEEQFVSRATATEMKDMNDTTVTAATATATAATSQASTHHNHPFSSASRPNNEVSSSDDDDADESDAEDSDAETAETSEKKENAAPESNAKPSSSSSPPPPPSSTDEDTPALSCTQKPMGSPMVDYGYTTSDTREAAARGGGGRQRRSSLLLRKVFGQRSSSNNNNNNNAGPHDPSPSEQQSQSQRGVNFGYVAVVEFDQQHAPCHTIRTNRWDAARPECKTFVRPKISSRRGSLVTFGRRGSTSLAPVLPHRRGSNVGGSLADVGRRWSTSNMPDLPTRRGSVEGGGGGGGGSVSNHAGRPNMVPHRRGSVTAATTSSQRLTRRGSTSFLLARNTNNNTNTNTTTTNNTTTLTRRGSILNCSDEPAETSSNHRTAPQLHHHHHRRGSTTSFLTLGGRCRATPPETNEINESEGATITTTTTTTTAATNSFSPIPRSSSGRANRRGSFLANFVSHQHVTTPSSPIPNHDDNHLHRSGADPLSPNTQEQPANEDPMTHRRHQRRGSTSFMPRFPGRRGSIVATTATATMDNKVDTMNHTATSGETDLPTADVATQPITTMIPPQRALRRGSSSFMPKFPGRRGSITITSATDVAAPTTNQGSSMPDAVGGGHDSKSSMDKTEATGKVMWDDDNDEEDEDEPVVPTTSKFGRMTNRRGSLSFLFARNMAAKEHGQPQQ